MSEGQAVPSPEQVAAIGRNHAAYIGGHISMREDIAALLAALDAAQQRIAELTAEAEHLADWAGSRVNKVREFRATIARVEALLTKTDDDYRRVLGYTASAKVAVAAVRDALQPAVPEPAETPHEFTEDVADGSMCVCGIPAVSHDAVFPTETPEATDRCRGCGHKVYALHSETCPVDSEEDTLPGPPSYVLEQDCAPGATADEEASRV